MKEIANTSSKKNDVKTDNSVVRANKAESFQSRHSPADQVLHLQRTIGNQAVGGLIESGALQAKLKIGQLGDRYEEEADRVAEQVMRMSNVQRQPEEEPVLIKPVITPLVQRQTEEEEILHTKELPGRSPEVTPALSSRIQNIRGGGQPLPESDRVFFETRFGFDFSSVRIHTGPHAADTVSSIDAQAFSVGQDIAFGAGQYSPESIGGRRLLAHELTHVVQQHPSNHITRSPVPSGSNKTDSDDDKIADVSDLIESQYPHLAKILTRTQLAELQSAFVIREEISLLRAELKEEDVRAKRKFKRFITRFHKRNPNIPVLYSEKRGYRGILSEINDMQKRLEEPGYRLTDKIRKLLDVANKKQAVTISTLELLDNKILARQPYNINDEDAFRRALLSKFLSQQTQLVLQEGLRPDPLLKLWWGKDHPFLELPHKGGLVKFEHLMQFRDVSYDYFNLVTRGPTYRLLMNRYNRLENFLNLEMDTHQFFRDLKSDQRLVSFFSNLLGGADMPSRNIWDQPRSSLDKAWKLLNASKVEDAEVDLIKANEGIKKGATLIAEYKSDTMKGAGRSITTLKVVEIAGAVAATIASGGSAGPGLLRTSLTIAAGAGGYGLTSSTAGQLSEYGLGLRSDIDVGAITKRGFIDFSTTLAGGLIAGKLSGALGHFIKLGEKSGVGRFVRSAGVEFISEGIAGGAVSAASNLKDLLQGNISGGEYLERIGWDSLKDGAIGAGVGTFADAWKRRGKLDPDQETPKDLTDPASWDTVSMKINKETGVVTQKLRHSEEGLDMELHYNPITENVSMSIGDAYYEKSTQKVTKIRESASAKTPSQPRVEQSTIMKIGKDSHELQVRNIGGWKAFFVCSNKCGPISDRIDKMLLDIPNKGPTKQLHRQLSDLKDRINKIEQDINSGSISEGKADIYVKRIGRTVQSLNKKYPKLADMFEQRFAPKDSSFTSIEEIKSLLKSNPGKARRKLAALIAERHDMQTNEVIRLFDENRFSTEDAVRKWEVAEDLAAHDAAISKDSDTTDTLSTIDKPKGSPPAESQIKGMLGEHRHAMEVVSKVPVESSKHLSSQTRRELQEKLVRDKNIVEFMKYYPTQGAYQVEFITSKGTRRTDHAYISGDKVILRESKNYSEIKMSADLDTQITKDLNLLQNYKDAIVEWRIDGKIDDKLKATLDKLVKENKGRFRYKTQL